VECERCKQKGYYMKENRGQGMTSNRQKWCGCQKRKEIKATCPKEGKA